MLATWLARMGQRCSPRSRHQVPSTLTSTSVKPICCKLTKTGQAGSRRGVGFELLLSDNTVYEQQGRFSVVDRTVDPKTGTIKVRASFPNASNRLRPGQFARLRVAAEEVSDAILVPQVAVQELQSAKYVMVVGSDNKVSQRTVKVGGPLRRLIHRDRGTESR